MPRSKPLSECPVTIFPPNDDCPAGGVNLDGESPENLMKFWAWGGASGSTRHSAAAAIFPLRQTGYVSATSTLRCYASNKAAAMACRARGDIRAASVYETICDRVYADLPEWAKW